MTINLKVKNQPGPYTAKLKRMTQRGDGFLPHAESPLGELAPGAEMDVSLWKGSYIVIEEKEE